MSYAHTCPPQQDSELLGRAASTVATHSIYEEQKAIVQSTKEAELAAERDSYHKVVALQPADTPKIDCGSTMVV